MATVLRDGNYQVTQTLIDNFLINNRLNHKSGIIYSYLLPNIQYFHQNIDQNINIIFVNNNTQ